MKQIQNIVIKKMEAADIEQIIKIAEECQLAVWRENEYRLEIVRKNSYVAGAFENGELVGFIAVRFDTPTAVWNSQYSEADIVNIGVTEKCRRMGIGSLLLNNFLDEARNLMIRSVWLEVRKSNFNARRFYLQKNFTEIQERRNFYTEPLEDAVLMKLELTKNHRVVTGKT